MNPGWNQWSLNPLQARMQFRLRGLTNLLMVLVFFIPLAKLIAPWSWAWAGDFVLIALSFYLFFYVLDGRAIGIECNHCNRYLKTNMPWICGNCEAQNNQTDEFPFINQCAYCRFETNAYQCHHSDCGKIIHLSNDESEKKAARCATSKLKEEESEEDTQLVKEKRALEHQIIMAELSAKLKLFQDKTKPDQKKSAYELKKESFSEFQAQTIAVQEIAFEAKNANKKKYQNDPEMLQKANEVVDEWVRQEL